MCHQNFGRKRDEGSEGGRAMVMDTVRSEKPSLDALEQTLEAIRKTTDGEELATLLFMAMELYSDGQCRCEEKAVTYGEGAAEAEACYWDINRKREKMFEAFENLVRELKGK